VDPHWFQSRSGFEFGISGQSGSVSRDLMNKNGKILELKEFFFLNKKLQKIHL